jgi:tRNA-dihydrouridine synthase 3
MKEANRQRKLAMLTDIEVSGGDSPVSTAAEAPSTPLSEKLKEVLETETTTSEVQNSTSSTTTNVSLIQTTETTSEATVVSNGSIEPITAPSADNAQSPVTSIDKEQPVGPIVDGNNKKKIDFKDKTYLAPLTTVGNLPFRRICKDFGVDITCGEMAMAPNLLQGQQAEWALTKRHVSEDLFGVQICGYKTEHLVKACEVINNTIDVDFVDLNMGCPIDLVFNKGGGSALLDSHGKLNKMLRGMQLVLDKPVTVKFRTGVKDNNPTAQKLVPKLETWGIGMGTLHGRSRQQRYSRLADWEYIKSIKELTNDMCLYGNGDILSWDQYYQQKEETGVDGIMIGRGALIKPWLFDEIKTRRHWDISSTERFDILKKFCNYGLEHWGSDTQGVNATRRFLCEWQSFLYRYIPVGLLEVLPQHMNERPPPYFGRDELETLMASPRASDWIKIT